ncbi:MAG: hypothetical protein ACTSU9_15605 [Promethearchaeota archaeon]
MARLSIGKTPGLGPGANNMHRRFDSVTCLPEKNMQEPLGT